MVLLDTKKFVMSPINPQVKENGREYMNATHVSMQY